MAHKKAQWSTSNGRDSNAKRLGVKVYGEQPVKSGGIIIRQKGNKYYPAEGVGQGTDFTLYAEKEGMVKYFKKNKTRYDGRVYNRTYVSVV